MADDKKTTNTPTPESPKSNLGTDPAPETVAAPAGQSVAREESPNRAAAEGGEGGEDLLITSTRLGKLGETVKLSGDDVQIAIDAGLAARPEKNDAPPPPAPKPAEAMPAPIGAPKR